MINKENQTGRTGGKTTTATNIHWADNTTYPVMRYQEREPLPPPDKVLREVDRVLNKFFPRWDSGALFHFDGTINAALSGIRARELGDGLPITTANICYTTPWLVEDVSKYYGPEVGAKLGETINALTKHQASKLHLNQSACINKRNRRLKSGHALTLKMMRRAYGGRAWKGAKSSDLLGKNRPTSPWSNGLPRMILVEGMGHTFLNNDLEILPAHLLDALFSDLGRRHIWEVVTKVPRALASLSHRMEGFPNHVICMTKVTSGKTIQLIDDLRDVDCHMRGLCIEPHREGLKPETLNLSGMDWLIVGGESGAKEHCEPLHLEWARELRDLCRQAGVAFFLNQLGSNPVEKGQRLKLSNADGGDWQEWPEDLRVREFPEGFHSYRRLAEAA